MGEQSLGTRTVTQWVDPDCGNAKGLAVSVLPLSVAQGNVVTIGL